ncbi:MAG: metallophosphoesterase family protein [Cyanobium sp.]
MPSIPPPATGLSRRQLLQLAGGSGVALLARGILSGGAARGAVSGAGRAGPLPDLPPRGDRRLVAISDLNGPYGSTSYLGEVHRAVALIPALAPDLVLCGGDMVAGQKQGLSAGQLAAMWAAFDRQLLIPLRRAHLPFALTLGNHDASGSRSAGRYSFALDRQEAERFWRPRRDRLGLRFVDGSRFPFAYSVLQNDLFLLVWDASAAQLPAEQLAWAERSLASSAAQGARARLVLGHLPLQPIAQGRSRPTEVLQQAEALQRLLERHNVAAYISGHHHAFFPGRSGSLDLLALGALGHGPRRLLGSTQPPRHTLTLIDMFWGRSGQPARRVYTSYDITSLRRIQPDELPESVVTPAGRVIRR